MATKASGAEIKAFFQDKESWPGQDGDTYYDDATFYVNGEESEHGIDVDALKDADAITLDGGYIFSPDLRINGRSLSQHFRKWKARQTIRTLVIECDASRLEAITAAIKAAGGKIR